MISTFTAFFDANVFFGARLRSLVIELSQTGLFRARWSDDVHREWIDAVCESRPDIGRDRLVRIATLMDSAVLDCKVSDYEHLIKSLSLPDPSDRHVLAAAISARASVIVTFNRGDYPDFELSRNGLHARHPDDFLLDLSSIDENAFLQAVARDLQHYEKPPMSIDEYAEDLRRAGVSKAADHVLRFRVLFEPLERPSPPPSSEN